MKKIALLFGGRSPEYAVSLASAAAVLAALDREKYEPIPIGITKTGAFRFLPNATPDKIARDAWVLGGRPCFLSQDPVRRGFWYGGGMRLLPDLIFPVLHGGAGEDGRLQGLLSLSGIPFIGSETEGAALAMNKAVAKRLAREAGVPVLPHLLFRGARAAKTATNTAKKTATEKAVAELSDKAVANVSKKARALGYPLFVKPNHGGSSVGAGIVRCEEELPAALARATAGGDDAIIEPFVSARELEVAILDGGGELCLSPVGEIVTDSDFYDYKSKYKDASTQLKLAELDPRQNTRVRAYAEKVFRALGLRHLARVDFFLSREDGRLYFNEVNTLPGFTAGSMYPRLLGGERGLSSLLDALISAALAP